MSTITATYSPDDNKLRLTSTARLDRETYERVRAAGFVWAPKQEQFIAPMWTPGRADLCIELAGTIEDEDGTLIDRAEDRAERFEEYGDKREAEAERASDQVRSITDHIPFGQPILVGHHSEQRARKDAERIQAGMRKAVQLFDTAEYWKRRAAAAIRHAKYKERADVRARRIKSIEADKRKQERNRAEAVQRMGWWAREGLTLEQARAIAAVCWLHVVQRDGVGITWTAYDVLLPDGQRNANCPAWSVEQVQEVAASVYPATIAHCDRWIAHYDNRLAYERGMLEEQGGLVAERFAIEVGGTVRVGQEWLVVLRVNRSGGRVVSVTTNARYGRVKSVEEVIDYRAPTADQSARVQAVTKLAPLCNYPGQGFVHITQAQWDAVSKDYKGTRTQEPTDTAARHRVRTALGCFLGDAVSGANERHRYQHVYITDAKCVQPPPATAAPVKASAVFAAVAADAAQAAPDTPPAAPAVETSKPAAIPSAADALRAQLRQGVQVVSAPQLFPTPPELAALMVDKAQLQIGMRVLEPSAGTGRLLEAMPGVVPFGPTRQTALQVVAVEADSRLAARLDASGLAGAVRCADFLKTSVSDLGTFDAVVMNPPFANAADIEHIEHALTMLRSGGRLVALCANGSRQNAKLRPLVEARGGDWQVLPPGSFASEGTDVRVVLLSFAA